MSDIFDFGGGGFDLPTDIASAVDVGNIADSANPYGLDAAFLGDQTFNTTMENPYGLDAAFTGDQTFNTTIQGGLETGSNINFYNPNISEVGTNISAPTSAYSFNSGAGANFYSSNLGEVTTGYYNPTNTYSLGTDASGVSAGINTQFATGTGFSADQIASSTISSGSADMVSGALSNAGGITDGLNIGALTSTFTGLASAAGINISGINGLISGLTGLVSGNGINASNINGLISNLTKLASVGGANVSAINGLISNLSGLATGTGTSAAGINGIISSLSGLASGLSQNSSQQFDTGGNAVGGSDNPNINKDTTALMQIGVYTNPGFFGDQSMKNSNVAFNNVVNLCTAIYGIASSLKSNPSPPPNYVRTATNYILTDKEKAAIDLRSTILSTYGVVPKDVLSAFFYILSAIENVNDLIYIGQVVGIPELGDNTFVRNILGILDIKNIYKVGYLANGVASVINKYANIFANIETTANPNMTTYGEIEQARTIALALGVIGPLMLSSATSLNGNVGILANAPNISSSNIDRVLNSTIQLAAGQAINLIGTALTNPSADIGQLASQISIGALKNVLNSTPLGGVLSAFGIFGGIAGGPLLSQMGGLAIGNYMSELITGKRIPTQKIANNPSLRPPSYAGKAFFGETPCALPAVDQLFCRKVGSFGEPTGGSGTDSFGMQNFASFGGALNIGSVIARMVTGSSVVPNTNSYYGQNVNTMIGNVCNILNVATGSTIEMRRSDNAIPMMIGLSAAIAGQSFSPFGSGTMSDGWKIASSAANEIQNINPGFLQACATSL